MAHVFDKLNRQRLVQTQFGSNGLPDMLGRNWPYDQFHWISASEM
jgi:hypothetical protein